LFEKEKPNDPAHHREYGELIYAAFAASYFFPKPIFSAIIASHNIFQYSLVQKHFNAE